MKHLLPVAALALLLASCSKTQMLTKTTINDDTQTAAAPAQKFPTQNMVQPVWHWATPSPVQYYDDALAQMHQMLDGQRPQSFEDAIFVTENAWCKGGLSYTQYDNYLNALAKVCKTWLRANPLKGYHTDDKCNIALSGAIYKLMDDTLKDVKGNIVTLPYHYNFNDPFGEKNWADRFINTLMATHAGNCHSLPFLYKILAGKLGVPAYLSLLPQHIYIKQYSKQYNWYNTELTSKSFPVDAWLMTTGCVSTDAIVSGIYMDTLGEKQSIVLCLNDLAKGYERQFGDNNLSVLNCCNLGLKYYPNYAELLLLKAETLKKLYQKDLDLSVYNTMQQTYATLNSLGYKEDTRCYV